jgi:hypothetical protein
LGAGSEFVSMRLLNSRSWQMVEFLSEETTPPYAILSHTWGSEEITLREWESLPAEQVQRKQGYAKIILTCQQADKDGIEWVWADT